MAKFAFWKGYSGWSAWMTDWRRDCWEVQVVRSEPGRLGVEKRGPIREVL